ncbi:MAG: flagellar hook-associated protein FlgL [Betaproteobacteria bacterium]|nr:flagellar hook-associated protein FlgL [Betaproteobacteria bacterium]
MTLRVSTSQAYDAGIAAIQRQQVDMLRTQQQIATGSRLVTPSDDPLASARALEIASGKARNDQYVANQTAAVNNLSYTEATLSDLTQVMQDIRALVIQAGDGAYGDGERASIAAELRTRRDHLLSLANTQDADGRYLFAGYQETVPPFSQSAAGVVFQGDTGRRALQVADSRSLAVTVNGADVFERVATGNGVFATSAFAGNLGDAIVDVGQVSNAAALDGHRYDLVFRVSAGVTTYDVVDVTAASTVSAGNAYQSGAAIGAAGMQAAVRGAPADGDRFSLTPSTRRSVFGTLDDFIAQLNAPVGSSAARAQLTMGIATALTGLDRAFEQVMLARTETGAALKELDQLGASAANIDLALQGELSGLRDLDYARAISDLTRQQTSLDAAQKTFVRVMGRSLFDAL